MSMVEWKNLGDEMKVLRGKRLTKNLLDDNAEYPVFHGGIEPLGKYSQFNRDENTVMVINVGASAGTVGYCDKKFWSSDGCFCISHSDKVNSKYLFYYLQCKTHYLQSQVRYAGIPTLDNSVVEKIEIPFISLVEQKSIVGKLDTFTASIDNLKEQIALRRKQYEYYCRNLFSTDKWSEKKIGELTKVFSCPRVFKDQWQDSGVPFWRSSDVMSYHNGVVNPRGEVFISQSLYEELLSKSEKIKEGDLLVTGGGSIGIPYLKNDDSPLFVKDADLICIQKCKSINPKYLYHYFLTTEFKLYLKKITHDATIAHYTINQIKDTPIPLPSISEQQRIVYILDKFEASIQNLEAQLSLREKQYEYYRNKLLTFE